YEMARAFERLPERAADDLGLPDACLLLAESLLVFDNVAQKIKVVSHVHVREGESLEAAYDAAVARIDALVARLAAPPVEPAALAAELAADPKERAEHVMLLDLGRNDVGRVAATATVQVTESFVIERYSHVMHLVSNVRGTLAPGRDCFDAFRATFPAGTLSG